MTPERGAPMIPNPGSPEAVALGCRCPVMDNWHGRGYRGMPGVYVQVEGCPVHAWVDEPAKPERERSGGGLT